MSENVWYLLLVVIVGSILLSFAFSNGNYSSIKDLPMNFLFSFATISIYATLLLGLHHFIINKELILIESYSAYIVFFFLIFMFATVFLIVSIALIFGTGS
ncbi:hypothetical protein [Frigoriflavimonas asaccharolytica]|uniref:Uncharacterized protein n=1 Tax=Frigoriflavimonas asaccharolytica TaxID=2735899 RepID=A0A8J8K446_9FLAO|nr:hypothetical protein [Frigoriflavimonas asaccharolytica]NRS91320.1 hypothetical protein [Frigoriflavimonas asaccharolytica]